MSQSTPDRQLVDMAVFTIDERLVAFVRDDDANGRFLEGIDPEYWTYQAATHGAQLDVDDRAHRQRAAAALRLAYGQALETLFALIGALVQAPRFPLGWMSAYSNKELRSVVRKIHTERALPTPLKRRATWESIADAVFLIVDEPSRSEVSARFAKLWDRLADEFLEEDFEPEYNSLKHGMRALVGGFTVAIGREKSPGQRAAPEDMQPMGGCEYGSTFWKRPLRSERHKCTSQFTEHVSRAWVPSHFTAALPLIDMSIRNVVSRLRIAADRDVKNVELVWPDDAAAFHAPWRERPTISRLSMGPGEFELAQWVEPTLRDVLDLYERGRG